MWALTIVRAKAAGATGRCLRARFMVGRLSSVVRPARLGRLGTGFHLPRGERSYDAQGDGRLAQFHLVVDVTAIGDASIRYWDGTYWFRGDD